MPPEGVHGLLLDLGVSSHQINEASRGFSYKNNGPLDMRMAGTTGKSAADIINGYAEKDIARVIKWYGEEPRANRIARCIAEKRPLTTTSELRDVICSALPPGPPKVERQAISRVFQALRLEVNDEVGALEDVLESAAGIVRPGGRLVVLSYHSLEDRRVKRMMRSGDKRGLVERDVMGNAISPWTPLRGVPKKPSVDEIDQNTRARSARLRAAERSLCFPPQPSAGGAPYPDRRR